MAKKWFKSYGWIYYPIKWPGYLITAFFLLFCINVFLAADRASHSVSDTFYNVFPYWIPAFLFWLWVAANTSKEK